MFKRAWYIGCALGLQPREEISIISVRSNVFAGVAYWLGTGSPVRSTEFDSPRPLQAGVAQVAEHRTRNAEGGVSSTPSGSKLELARGRAALRAVWQAGDLPHKD